MSGPFPNNNAAPSPWPGRIAIFFVILMCCGFIGFAIYMAVSSGSGGSQGDKSPSSPSAPSPSPASSGCIPDGSQLASSSNADCCSGNGIDSNGNCQPASTTSTYMPEPYVKE